MNDTGTRPPRRSKWRRRLLIYGLAYLLGASLVMFGGCADRLILFPTVIDARPLGPRRHMLPHAGGQIEIWTAPAQPSTRITATTAPAPEPQAFILSFNGNADRADNMVVAESYLWAGHPVEIWAMNYPGYGLSTGPARLRRLGPAALATFDELKQRAGDRPILVSGMSLGSAVALHVAASRDVDGVVLYNPPPLRELILGRFGWWNLWLAAGPVALSVPSELSSLENARRTKAPGVFLMSAHDQVVPHAYQQRVFDAYAGPKQALTQNAGHNDALTPQGERDMRAKLQWLLDQTTTPP